MRCKDITPLGLESYARLDFIVTEDEKIYCLEANTLPGMTPTSLIPQEAAVLGMDYPALCEGTDTGVSEEVPVKNGFADGQIILVLSIRRNVSISNC